jgi:hypothetical protein
MNEKKIYNIVLPCFSVKTSVPSVQKKHRKTPCFSVKTSVSSVQKKHRKNTERKKHRNTVFLCENLRPLRAKTPKKHRNTVFLCENLRLLRAKKTPKKHRAQKTPSAKNYCAAITPLCAKNTSNG